MTPMSQLSSPDVFSQLDHIAQWFHNCLSPKASIPKGSGLKLSLSAYLPVSCMAKHLGLWTAERVQWTLW